MTQAWLHACSTYIVLAVGVLALPWLPCAGCGRRVKPLQDIQCSTCVMV
jgi:hypothetical protein